MEWLSRGVEVLIEELAQRKTQLQGAAPMFQAIVIGSGYGGAVAAARLAGAGMRVCVLERGREYQPGDFPSDWSGLPGHVRVHRPDAPTPVGRPEALFDVHLGADIGVIVANALGGGSQINANVAERVDPRVFDRASWPGKFRDNPAILDAHYAKVEAMLDARPYPDAGNTPAKLQQLFRLRPHLDRLASEAWDARQAGVTATRPNLAVNFSIDGTNPHGVEQKPCVGCGDCITGCTWGAKNTLSTNYLPHAVSLGARLYTGAQVLSLHREGDAWQVAFRNIQAETEPGHPIERIEAEIIILAAGTLGSTEILMRSQRWHGLALSARLGCGFSGNGDQIGFGFDQDQVVNAVGTAHPGLGTHVGPTITGMLDTRAALRPERAFVIQDAAVPGALGWLFRELVTTAAVPGQMMQADFRGDTGADNSDPLAVSDKAIAHTQVYLAIGHDSGEGQMILDAQLPARPTPADLDRLGLPRIRVRWPDIGNQKGFEAVAQALEESRQLGAVPLANPLWKPLPENFNHMLSGPPIKGAALTVHPLGGCAMADNPERGVVNHCGQVFDASKRSTPTDDASQGERAGWPVHAGLYVLDGSIMPTSLGVNPFLTIAALAERNVELLLAAHSWAACAKPAEPQPLPPVHAPLTAPPTPAPDGKVAVEFSERMCGRLAGNALAALFPAGESGMQATDAALDIAFRIDDIAAFLRDPRHGVAGVVGKLELGANANAGATRLPVAYPIHGTIALLVRESSHRLTRTARALTHWFHVRGRREIAQIWRARDFGRLGRHGDMLRLAAHVGERRLMLYRLTFEANGEEYLLQGEKILQYGGEDANPWRQLADLKVRVRRKRDDCAVAVGTLSLDLLDAVENRKPRILAQPDAPRAWAALASVALFFARVIFKTHFWSFEAPAYASALQPRQRLPGPLADLRQPGSLLERTQHRVCVDPGKPDMPVLLTRYRSPTRSGAQPPVLLLHGFAHGGLVFATHTVDENLAQHLAARERDVWILDLRTSTGLASSACPWDFDEIAGCDVPGAIDYVLAISGQPQGCIDVIAHCMGSAVFSMAALSGRLQHADGRSKIRRAVLMQVAPFIVGSPANRLRANMAAFLRDALAREQIDASVDDSANWLDVLADRFASTYPQPSEESASHHQAPCDTPRRDLANCNRIAALFGRNWMHRNLTPQTHAALGDLLGRANMKTFSHITWIVERGRIVDKEGRNVYAIEENIRRWMQFPIAFVHGAESDVFDPQTTLGSAREFARINPDSHYRHHLIAGYGHLDCLIGANAAADVFPQVSAFLAEPRLAPATGAGLAVAPPDMLAPHSGPMLGWLRADAQGRALARLWVKAAKYQVNPAEFLVTAVYRETPGGLTPVAGAVQFTPIESVCGEPIAVADVELSVGAEGAQGAQGAQGAEDLVVFAACAGAAIRRLPTDALLRALRAMDAARCTLRVSRDLIARSLAPQQEICLLLASCRYPGSPFERDLSDAIFGPMLECTSSGTELAPSALLLVGDQIYADATAQLFASGQARERFVTRYDEAWGSERFRALTRSLPVYMTCDDHEIADNWDPAHETRENGRQTLAWAHSAYRAHQWSLTPRTAAGTTDPWTCTRYWYEFDIGGFAFFMMDTRFDRQPRPGRPAADAEFIGQEQLGALIDWLDRQHEGKSADEKVRPKFIACGSVIVPVLAQHAANPAYRRRDDSWFGHQKTLKTLLEHIASRRIENVVFLCGDYHCSFAAEMRYAQNGRPIEGLRSFCVVSSPLYAPMPFANGRIKEYLLDSRADRRYPLLRATTVTAGGFSMDYSVANSRQGGPAALEGDNFARIHAYRDNNRWRLGVTLRDRDGQAKIDAVL